MLRNYNVDNFVFAKGGCNGDFPTEVTSSDFDRVVAKMLSANMPLSDQFSDSHKYDGIIRSWYVCFIPKSYLQFVRNVYGFTDSDNYPIKKKSNSKSCGGNDRAEISSYERDVTKLTNEVGTVGNLRIFVKPDSDLELKPYKSSAKNNPIYRIICMPLQPFELHITCCTELSKASHYNTRVELLCT